MDWRDELAEEMGYTICPLAIETYTICDNKCEECELYIDFKESLEKTNIVNLQSNKQTQ